MGQARTFCWAVSLALLWSALPCAAQGVPTPQDTLEHNLNSLRGPSPGAPDRVGPLTPQQSLDRNIGGLRSSGPIRNAPTPQHYPPATARGPNHHPGADALLYGTGARVAPGHGGPKRKGRKGRRHSHPRY